MPDTIYHQQSPQPMDVSAVTWECVINDRIAEPRVRPAGSSKRGHMPSVGPDNADNSFLVARASESREVLSGSDLPFMISIGTSFLVHSLGKDVLPSPMDDCVCVKIYKSCNEIDFMSFRKATVEMHETTDHENAP